MLSWLGFGTRRRRDPERRPLLPQYDDETARQQRLHEKLHTYQMLRAMCRGYMPSTEQVIVHLRCLMSADVLNPDGQTLSSSGRALISSAKLWLAQLVEVLRRTNSHDQIQDFIWCLSKARLDVDTRDLGAKAAAYRARADASATLASLQTIGSLLLTNSDFRIFLADLGTVGRNVFRDTAFTLANVSEEAGNQLAPSAEASEALGATDGRAHASASTAPSSQELGNQMAQVAHVVSSGAAEVAHEASHSVSEHVSGDEGRALARRLKQTVLRLRQRRDYSESVSVISLLLQRYLGVYARLATDTVHAVEEDVSANADSDVALRNFWTFVTGLGDAARWREVEQAFGELVEAGKADAGFEAAATELAKLVRDVLTDADFFDNFEKADERFGRLKGKSAEATSGRAVADRVEALVMRTRAALGSVAEDKDVQKLVHISKRIATLVWPRGAYKNDDLVRDAMHSLVPLAVQGVQYVPVPRLELSTPAVDLLLENLMLEPGRTVNHSSFLPYSLKVSTQNDFLVQKARFQTTSSASSRVQITLAGLSLAADDVGYWVKVHSGLLRMTDQGLAGFHLDQGGIDVTLDVEIGRDRIQELVSLRSVEVRVHHLDYSLRNSRFGWVAWLLKPVLRPVLRKALEVKVAAAAEQGLRTLNRELLFARERLRATRIANPDDLLTFVRAVATRLTPAPDPDVAARVGVRPGGGDVFRGRYAPGSLVRLWEDEGLDAAQRVLEYERGGWRSGIFDVKTAGNGRVAQA